MHKLLKQASGNTLTIFIVQPISILTSILVAREIGVYGKGVYAFLLVLMTLASPIFHLGYDSGTYYMLSSKKFKLKEIITSVYCISIIFGIIASSFLYLVYDLQLLGTILDSIENKFFLLFIISIPVYFTYHSSQRILMSTSNFKLNNIITIIRHLLLVFFLIYFVLFKKMEINGIILTIFLSNIFIALTAIICCFNLINFKPSIWFNIFFIKESMIYGLKAWYGNLSSVANDMLDQFLLGFLTTAEFLGIYSVSYNYSKLVTKPINQVFNVLFNRIALKGNEAKKHILIAKIHRLIFYFALLLSVFLIFLADKLIPLLYGNDFYVSVQPTYILIPSLILFMITRRVTQVFLMSNGYPMKGSYIQLSGTVIGFISYMLLIPKYGYMGAAIGTSIAYVASTIFGLVMYKSIAKFEIYKFFKLSVDDLFWLKSKFLQKDSK